MDKNINIKLRIWRQKGPKEKGGFENYELQTYHKEVRFSKCSTFSTKSSSTKEKDPVVFDHDCREGICGMCSLYINGHPHGPDEDVTTCQLHMRKSNDGDTITVEPWAIGRILVIKDLMVDRSAFDKIIQAGGYISVNTGGVPDANSIPIPKEQADMAMDAAACIGCGACVAACKNGSAMLFVSAKVSQFALLPCVRQKQHAGLKTW